MPYRGWRILSGIWLGMKVTTYVAASALKLALTRRTCSTMWSPDISPTHLHTRARSVAKLLGQIGPLKPIKVDTTKTSK